MSAQTKQPSLITRRLFSVVLLGMIVLFGGLAALFWYAYTSLASQPASAQNWAAIRRLVWDAAPMLGLALAILLAVTLLLVWLLTRWTLHPFTQLVEIAAAIENEGIDYPLPVRSRDEAGQIARMIDMLSQSLRHSRDDFDQQYRTMNASIRNLQGLLQVSQELSATLDINQMLSRVASSLRAAFDYQLAGVALVEKATLTYYLQSETSDDPTTSIQTPLNEKSVVGRVALTGTPVHISDFLVDQRFVPSPGLITPRSEIAVPVIDEGQLQAVLMLQSDQANVFTKQDEQQLTTIATLLANALANAQHFHTEQSRRRRAETLFSIAGNLSATITTEQVPETLLDQLARIVRYDRSALLLIDQGEVEIKAVRSVTNGPVPEHTRIALKDLPLITEIVERGQAIWLRDAQDDSRYRPTIDTVSARSWIGTPIVRQNRVVGALVLERDEPDCYSEEDFLGITRIAHQAAIAMEYASRYAEAQERAQRLEIITHITQIISTRDVSRELPAILRTIIHLIRRVVACDFAALALYYDEDDTFFVETVYDFSMRNWSDLPVGQRIPANETVWQTACRTAGPVVQSELSRSVFSEDQSLAANGLHSGVVVPIIGANHTIGALNFASRRPSAYGQAQIATLLELSHYLGPALHNARLNQEREETSIKLARTQEHLNLVDKVRVVGQLASGVAHDFNNLLAGILGNAQLLLFEIQDEEQRKMLKIIERAAKDGTETVRRLQGFARMEHDSPMTEVRLDMLARDAIDITRPRWRDVAQSRGASIEIVRRTQPVTPIAGRPAELREVLTNLIINAVDALPQGGKITVATYDEIDPNDGGGTVVVEIADSGIGMPPDVCARIFDPFFTTKGEHGTGLGLAVSLGIIQSHNGDIEVESEVGGGTRFIIRLPIRNAEVVSARKDRKQVSIMPGNVLFVENEEMIREATVRLLTRWGHRVAQASGAIEALQMFTPGVYDVVISDLGMPDMSGWDLLAEIKQRDQNVPTVLITGWGRQVTEEENHARDVDFVIEKPFDQDDLREVLAAAMAPKENSI